MFKFASEVALNLIHVLVGLVVILVVVGALLLFVSLVVFFYHIALVALLLFTAWLTGTCIYEYHQQNKPLR